MTETLTEQPTHSLTIERCTMLTFPEPAVGTPSNGPAYVTDGVTTDEAFPVYIHENGDGREDWVGTVKLLKPAPSGNGWLDRETPTAGEAFNRYYGSVVNPAPVNGRHYRTIGGGVSVLVRYNDDEHGTDRHLITRPWSLIRSEGENAWTIPNDGLTSMSGFPYIEVRFDPEDASDDEQPDTAESDTQVTAVRTAETEEVQWEGPARWEDGERTATRGLAMKEEDGTVLLDPELVPGQAYIFWQREGFVEEAHDSYLAYYIGGDTEMFASYRHFGSVDYSTYSNEVRFSSSHYEQAVGTNVSHWAKLALTRPEPNEERTASYYRETLNNELVAFDEFNEKTNDIAEDAGWCEEYDRIVKSVGMRGRQKDWDVTVTADFTFDDNSPSSTVDEAYRSIFGEDGITISRAELRATLSVTVRVEAANSSDADEQVDSSNIEERLRSMLPGARNIDVQDWTVEETEEA